MAKNSNQEDILDDLTIRIRKRAGKTLWEMAEELQAEMKKNASIVDMHTPDWLKRAGHPYAGRPPLPHNPPLVHKVTGKLSDGIKIFPGRRKDELRVGVSSAEVPYADYVIHGTRKMVARDFLSYSLLKLNRKFRKKIEKDLEKATKDKIKFIRKGK